MDAVRRALVVLLVAGCVAVPRAAGQTPAPEAPAALTLEQMEAFLLRASIISKQTIPTGVTAAIRATLSDGTLTHDAQIQAIDQSKQIFQAGKASEVGFRDSYRYNVAGYRLARFMALDNVPMSVERRVDGKPVAVTWWIDNVMMDEKARLAKQTVGPDPTRTANQMHMMRVWDELIQNRDRNQGNILWTKDWKLWMIDHTRAFRIGRELLKPNDLIRIERSMLDRLRRMTADAVAPAVGRSLTRDEIAAVVARARLLVSHFDARIASSGEVAVLF